MTAFIALGSLAQSLPYRGKEVRYGVIVEQASSLKRHAVLRVLPGVGVLGHPAARSRVDVKKIQIKALSTSSEVSINPTGVLVFLLLQNETDIVPHHIAGGLLNTR